MSLSADIDPYRLCIYGGVALIMVSEQRKNGKGSQNLFVHMIRVICARQLIPFPLSLPIMHPAGQRHRERVRLGGSDPAVLPCAQQGYS